MNSNNNNYPFVGRLCCFDLTDDFNLNPSLNNREGSCVLLDIPGIDGYYALTAAHMMYESVWLEWWFPFIGIRRKYSKRFQLKNYSVIFPQQKFRIVDCWIHPKYFGYLYNPYDIALLKIIPVGNIINLKGLRLPKLPTVKYEEKEAKGEFFSILSYVLGTNSIKIPTIDGEYLKETYRFLGFTSGIIFPWFYLRKSHFVNFQAKCIQISERNALVSCFGHDYENCCKREIFDNEGIVTPGMSGGVVIRNISAEGENIPELVAIITNISINNENEFGKRWSEMDKNKTFFDTMSSCNTDESYLTSYATLIQKHIPWIKETIRGKKNCFLETFFFPKMLLVLIGCFCLKMI